MIIEANLRFDALVDLFEVGDLFGADTLGLEYKPLEIGVGAEGFLLFNVVVALAGIVTSTSKR